MEKVKSEFFEDLEALHAAFEIHVKKDEKNRSILVLAEDKVGEDNMISTTVIDSKLQIANLIIHFLRHDEEGLVREYLLMKLRRCYRNPIRKFSMVMFFVCLSWLCALLAIWFHAGISDGLTNFISNVLITVWSCFVTFFMWKKSL